MIVKKKKHLQFDSNDPHRQRWQFYETAHQFLVHPLLFAN